MAYQWGLRPQGAGPASDWMLTSDLFSPSALVLIVRAVNAFDQ